ncbi:hypothetical protein [Prevotella koreensis]
MKRTALPRRYTIEPIIMENPREYRKTNPGVGAPKLHAILKKLFYDTGCFPVRARSRRCFASIGFTYQVLF